MQLITTTEFKVLPLQILYPLLMESSIDYLEQYPTDFTLAYGFTSLFWVIQHLINNG